MGKMQKVYSKDFKNEQAKGRYTLLLFVEGYREKFIQEYVGVESR